MFNDIGNLTKEQLENLIETKRTELNKLFGNQGLNDFTLKKSQELDVLIVKAQRLKLEETNINNIIIA